MKAESIRVVIDSNVWISAALSPSGSPALLVQKVLKQGLPVFSPQTFAELETRLSKPKFDAYLSKELRQRILHDLNASAYWVEIPPAMAAQAFCRDADDDKFIHTALVSQAVYLVTGDQDLLALYGSPLLPGLCILSPAEAL